MITYDDGDLYDLSPIGDADYHFKWKKMLKKTTKNLNFVKKYADNPIVRGIVGVIPFGGTALTALDAATAVANTVSTGNRKKILNDPTVQQALNMVPGGVDLINTLGFLDGQERQATVKAIKISNSRITPVRRISDTIREELDKRRFMPNRAPMSLTPHIKTLKALKNIQSSADLAYAFEEDEYEDEPAPIIH